MHTSSMLTAAALGLSLSFAAFVGSAQAQHYSTDIMTQCMKQVSQYKFEGWPADRNREMMALACEANGGRVPGATEEKPVSLEQRQPARVIEVQLPRRLRASRAPRHP